MKIYIWISIFFVLAFVYNYFYSHIKGKIGEYVVAFILRRLPKSKYIVINDIVLETKDGTTQIDHIVLSKYGIFVIETKNYKGWIYGNEYAEKWTQNLFGHKYYFLNPIKQNYGHLKTLEILLNIEEAKFFPIVVFSLSSTLKGNYKSPVLYTLSINKYIKKQKNELILDDIDEIKNKILSANINTKEIRKKHVDNIRKKIDEFENNICPKCGGNLIVKKSKFGYFKGCSNYPNCTYISKKSRTTK